MISVVLESGLHSEGSSVDAGCTRYQGLISGRASEHGRPPTAREGIAFCRVPKSWEGMPSTYPDED